MKERPILFNTRMVRTLLDGSKTQTRRVYKNRKHPDAGCDIAASELVREPQHVIDRICPYGQPGERLWVRETFGYNPDHPGILAHCCYRADPGHEHDGIIWKPSIHMPRAASRIMLEIVSVRVERLNDISEADARAEGVDRVENNFGNGPAYCDYALSRQGDTAEWFSDSRLSFRSLWEPINGAGSWEANPWVWVIEFNRGPA